METSAKRKNEPGTGLTPENKERKTNQVQMSSSTSTSSSATVISNGMSYAQVLAETNPGDDQSIMSQRSYFDKSVGMKAGTSTGLLRDQITVDVETIDDQPMKDHLTQKERLKIYERIGLSSSIYNGVSQGWSGHPNYTYRLKEHVDVSDFKSPEITIHRLKKFLDGTKVKQVIRCRIRGILDDPKQHERIESAYDPNVKWIKFERTQYKLTGNQIKKWMEQFGEILTELEEETEKIENIEDETDTEDEDFVNLSEDFKATLPEVEGTGTFKAKIKFNRKPPQYIPAFGQKVRLYYQGIEKTCTGCYGTGHIKKFCKQTRKPWINYVKQFMENNKEVPTEMYGRWSTVVHKEFNIKIQQTVEHPSNKIQIEQITHALNEIRSKENLRGAASSMELETELEPEPEPEAEPEPEVELEPETTDINNESETFLEVVQKPETEPQRSQVEEHESEQKKTPQFVLPKVNKSGTQLDKKRVGRPKKGST